MLFTHLQHLPLLLLLLPLPQRNSTCSTSTVHY
jgi:hypothetical protein